MVHHKSPGDGRKYAIGRDLIEEGIMTWSITSHLVMDANMPLEET